MIHHLKADTLGFIMGTFMVKVDECVSKSSKLNFEISVFFPIPAK